MSGPNVITSVTAQPNDPWSGFSEIIPRRPGELLFNPEDLLRAWQEGKAKIWVVGPGGERTRLEDLMPEGRAKSTFAPNTVLQNQHPEQAQGQEC